MDNLKVVMLKLQERYADTGAERVGFILKDYTIVEVLNTSNDPENSFSVSGQDIMKYACHEAIGSWHTHPNQASNLSGEDYGNFMKWKDLFHLIIGNDGTKCFRCISNSMVETRWEKKTQL